VTESEYNPQCLVGEASGGFGLEISRTQTKVQCIAKDKQPLNVDLFSAHVGDLQHSNDFVCL